MKLGQRRASPLNDLEKVVLPVRETYHSDDEVAAAMAQPLDEEEATIFWEDLRKESSSRRSVYGAARANRIERELEERFGRFAGVATHPWSRAAAAAVEDAASTRLVGDPVLPVHTSVILLFMAWRGGMPAVPFVLLSCLLFAAHPVLVAAGAVAAYAALARPRKPKRRPAAAAPIIVVGGGPRGLYCAALLAKSGHAVEVLVPEAAADGGSTVEPDGAPCAFCVDPFELGQAARYARLLKPVLARPVALDAEINGFEIRSTRAFQNEF